MLYEVNFGSVSRPPREATPTAKFRLAVLGDFSGRANAGKLETGEALARRKPIKVDVDNLDDVLERMQLALNLPMDEEGGVVTVKIASMDDFHPDQIVENVELFENMLTLRRNLGSKAGFDRAAKEVLSWGGEEPLPPPPRKARGTAIATDRKLSDFARLTGRSAPAEVTESSADDLIRRLVGPYVVPARDARQEQLTQRVDEALSATMRRILHHPDFQSAEAIWRGLEFLVRRIETGARMEIVLYDVSAEELAADVAGADALEETGLYAMLVEQPGLDAHQGPLSAVVGLYGFEFAPPHADLLGRIAQIAAAGYAPFVSSISPDPMKVPFHDQHPLIKEAWSALFELPAAAYLGLATPRFLLRMPYGKKTDPIDPFAFEEFTREAGLSGLLWGNAALVPALLLAEGWAAQGAKMKLGSKMVVGNIPYYVYVDKDGEQIALPCTERLYTERQSVQVSNYKVMPLLSLRGRPELRLGSFSSLAGTPLAGSWNIVTIEPRQPAPAAPAVPEPPKAAAPEPEAVVETPVPAAASVPVAEPAPQPAPEPAGGDEDLDALLAGLAVDTPAPVEEASADDDLDALLASLSAEPEPTPEGEVDADLDALLASLA